jgi:hypothetical protein
VQQSNRRQLLSCRLGRTVRSSGPYTFTSIANQTHITISTSVSNGLKPSPTCADSETTAGPKQFIDQATSGVAEEWNSVVSDHCVSPFVGTLNLVDWSKLFLAFSTLNLNQTSTGTTSPVGPMVSHAQPLSSGSQYVSSFEQIGRV